MQRKLYIYMTDTCTHHDTHVTDSETDAETDR